jgi:hypothetical protein
MTDEQKLYASAAGFEDKADQENESARIARYIETHTECRAKHHRLKTEGASRCPICNTLAVFNIQPEDVPKESLR